MYGFPGIYKENIFKNKVYYNEKSIYRNAAHRQMSNNEVIKCCIREMYNHTLNLILIKLVLPLFFDISTNKRK